MPARMARGRAGLGNPDRLRPPPNSELGHYFLLNLFS